VAWEGKYMGDSSDFSDILAPIQSLNPDVVFLPGHGSDSGLIVKQARSMGITTVFLGGDGWGKGMLGIAGAMAAEGSYFANHWHVDVANPGNAEFLTRYRRLYGEGSVAASAALAYDSVNLVAAAVRKAGSFDRKAIRDALAGTSKFQGITGSITLNAQRDPVGKSGVVMQYRNGEIRFVKSVSPR
jgi:branched-chain amino acid transport system substrate-binding protein